MNTLLDQLVSIAKTGFSIFPCWSIDLKTSICTCGNPKCGNVAKHPATPHGCKDATTNEAQILRWVTESNGRYNWAIATGNGFGVLDIDPKNDGDGSWLRLGLDCSGISLETPAVKTGSGGRHYYYRLPPGVTIGNRAGFRPGLDWRGDGGYVLIPPSLHRSGRHYEWERPIDSPLALPPDCLLGELKKPHGPRPLVVTMAALPKVDKLFSHAVVEVDSDIVTKNGIVTVVTVGGVEDLTAGGVKEGRRNESLCRRVGVHIARGENLEEIEQSALAWNAKCDPPEEEGQVLASVQSLWDKEHKKREAQADTKPQPTLTADRSISPPLLLGDDSLQVLEVGKEGNTSGPVEGDNSFPPCHGEAPAQEQKIVPSALLKPSQLWAARSMMLCVSTRR